MQHDEQQLNNQGSTHVIVQHGVTQLCAANGQNVALR